MTDNILSWFLEVADEFPCQMEGKHTQPPTPSILILAQLIWSAFMLTSNHYAPVI